MVCKFKPFSLDKYAHLFYSVIGSGYMVTNVLVVNSEWLPLYLLGDLAV